MMKQPQPSLTKALAERVALFFPVVDAAPVHDHRRRQLSSAAADGRRWLCLGRESPRVRPGCRNISMPRETSRGFSHSRGAFPACSETDGARCRSSRRILERPSLACGGVAGFFGGDGLFFPARAQARSMPRPRFRLRNWAFWPALLPTSSLSAWRNGARRPTRSRISFFTSSMVRRFALIKTFLCGSTLNAQTSVARSISLFSCQLALRSLLSERTLCANSLRNNRPSCVLTFRMSHVMQIVSVTFFTGFFFRIVFPESCGVSHGC